LENLVPRAAYDVDETGYWRRMPIILGVAMSAVGILILWATIGPHLQPRDLLIRALAGGGMFALLFSGLMQWLTGQAVSRAYAGVGQFAATPPPAQEFAYRLPCSLVKARSLVIGGTLYLGGTGLLFVPHERYREPHREQLAFSLDRLAISAVPAEVAVLLRPMIARAATLLELQSGALAARFVVPAPMATIPRVKQAVEELRHAG
jgi:hypothetical protein